jgi:hypothetical protein
MFGQLHGMLHCLNLRNAYFPRIPFLLSINAPDNHIVARVLVDQVQVIDHLVVGVAVMLSKDVRAGGVLSCGELRVGSVAACR